MSTVDVLVIEDDDDDALLLVRHLRRAGLQLTYRRAQTASEVIGLLAEREPDIVICDYQLPVFGAMEALDLIHQDHPDLPIIVVSGAVGEEIAAAVMKAGAHDVILKDRLTRLAPAVSRELRDAAARYQRQQVEVALRESEERFRLLAEHVRDVVFRLRIEPEGQPGSGTRSGTGARSSAGAPPEPAGESEPAWESAPEPRPTLEYVSPAAAELTGHPIEQLYADSSLLFAMVVPEHRQLLVSAWSAPLPRPVLLRCQPDPARTLWLEQRAIGVRDHDGTLVAVEGILRDITAQVYADEERGRLDRQLRQAERLDSLGRLAGGIGHDFNNLIAVIMSYAGEVLESLPGDDPCRGDVEKINQAAERGAALTRQLLVFSRSEPTEPQLLDLNDVIIDLDRLLRPTIGEDIEFLISLEDALPAIMVDRSKLEQVIMNLVVNARLAMPRGGRLKLTTSRVSGADATADDSTGSMGSTGSTGSTVEASGSTGDGHARVFLTVSDTGEGMSPEVASRAFEPFFTTRQTGQGTGLGLSTVYGIVTEAGGVVDLQTSVGEGTTFTIELPAVLAQVPAPSVPLVRVPRGDGRVVLLVEDDTAVRDAVARLLRRAGYQVTTAASGVEALKVCENSLVHIDALLSDVVMPEMSGYEVARRFKSARPHLPILLMSGYTPGAMPGPCAPPPGVPLIRKPFHATALLAQLGRLLDSVDA